MYLSFILNRLKYNYYDPIQYVNKDIKTLYKNKFINSQFFNHLHVFFYHSTMQDYIIWVFCYIFQNSQVYFIARVHVR